MKCGIPKEQESKGVNKNTNFKTDWLLEKTKLKLSKS
jgi:hypothetical protein